MAIDKKEYMRAWHAAHPPDKAAMKEYRRRYYEANREKLQAQMKAYAQEHREERRERMRRYRAANRDKTRTWQASYVAANQETVRARARDWYANHPEKVKEQTHKRRALLRNVFVSPVTFEEIWQRDRGICQLCKRAVARRAAHLDHIVPLAAGGTHEPSNVQLAHARCNLRKGAGRTPSQTRLL